MVYDEGRTKIAPGNSFYLGGRHIEGPTTAAIPALANMGADNFYRLPKLQA